MARLLSVAYSVAGNDSLMHLFGKTLYKHCNFFLIVAEWSNAGFAFNFLFFYFVKEL